MENWLIVLNFLVIAVMRVVQQICSKKVSGEVKGQIFFHYGGYYNLISAAFSLVALAFVGFYGFDLPTVLCSLGTAIFMAIELFALIEALKGCRLIVAFLVWAHCLFLVFSGYFYLTSQ